MSRTFLAKNPSVLWFILILALFTLAVTVLSDSDRVLEASAMSVASSRAEMLLAVLVAVTELLPELNCSLNRTLPALASVATATSPSVVAPEVMLVAVAERALVTVLAVAVAELVLPSSVSSEPDTVSTPVRALSISARTVIPPVAVVTLN